MGYHEYLKRDAEFSVNKYLEAGRRQLRMILSNSKIMLKWLVLSLIIGAVSGAIGSVFHLSVEIVTQWRAGAGWLVWLMPLAGLAIVAIYKLFKVEGQGTNDVIEEINNGKGLKLSLLPSIFASTVLTHLTGGSAGREGAALQMGGSLGYAVARGLRLTESEQRIATLAGMAAFFSALFGTPLAAAVFVIAVVNVGSFRHAAFLPCFMAALAAYGVSRLMGVEPTFFIVDAPPIAFATFLRVAVLGILSALVSVLFCETLHMTERLFRKYLPNVWIRAAVGGLLIALLTCLTPGGDYNGAGMNVIARAIEQGQAVWYAFALKIIFTAITLGAGFKGGEVVPSFFVGATFGAAIAPLIGLPAGFGAALGLISVFCGAVNCPIATIFLSAELFGTGGIWYFALVCGLSFLFSGYSGIYSSQLILYDKLRADLINVHTNERRNKV